MPKLLEKFNFFSKKSKKKSEIYWANSEKLEKASPENFLERFREIVSDPINQKIIRIPAAGYVDQQGMILLHNGHRVPWRGPGSYYENFSDILVINRGVHEPLEEYCFQQVLRMINGQGKVMIELGSYWAHYSMWFLKYNPQATSYLIDPVKENLTAGQENFKRNGYRGVFIQSFIGHGHLSIDSFIAQKNIENITLLHVDIQGYELEMLEGAEHALGNHQVDYIFISTHSEKLHQESLSKLRDYGYRIEISSGFEKETTSHDGFILACAPQVKSPVDGWTPLGRLEILQLQEKSSRA
jgi:hypothetical protein